MQFQTLAFEPDGSQAYCSLYYQAMSLQPDGSSVTLAAYDAASFTVVQVQTAQPTATSIELRNDLIGQSSIVWQLTLQQELQIEADIQAGTATDTEKSIWQNIKSFFGF